MDSDQKLLCLHEQFAKMYLYLRQRIKSSQRVSFDTIFFNSMM